MNQIRSDRDTKTHMLVRRGRSIISLLRFCSFFLIRVSFCDILLDYYSLTKETCNYFPLQVGYWVFFLENFVLREEHSCALTTFTGVVGWLHRHEWANKCPTPCLLPLLYLVFSGSLIPTPPVVLLGCGTRRAAMEEAPQ